MAKAKQSKPAKITTEYVILHFVSINGEDERLMICETPDMEDESIPPTGFKLYKVYGADIQDAMTLPLGRTLIRER
jgi:hypothetical protein